MSLKNWDQFESPKRAIFTEFLSQSTKIKTKFSTINDQRPFSTFLKVVKQQFFESLQNLPLRGGVFPRMGSFNQPSNLIQLVSTIH